MPFLNVRVKDILTIRLGGVTGASKFFLLSEVERRAHALSSAALVPVVSRARHLTTATVTRTTWSKLRDMGERVRLFRPPASLTGLSSVRRYMQKGKSVRGALKVRTRDPWYRTPPPPQVDGFVSGMASRRPWIALNQMSKLSATNTLYVVQFRNPCSVDERSAWALSLLATTIAGISARYIRFYPDGLRKLEPRDFGEIPLRRPTQTNGATRAYAEAIAAFLAGDIESVIRRLKTWGLLDIADEN